MARENCGRLAVPRTAHVQLTRYLYTTHVLENWMQWTLCLRYERLVTCTELQKCLLCFLPWNNVTCILCRDFATEMHVLLLKNTKGVFPTEGFRLEVYILVFTRVRETGCLPSVAVQSERKLVRTINTREKFLRWFREVHVCPLVEWPLASAYHVCRCGELNMKKIYILTKIKGYNFWNQETMLNFSICATGLQHISNC